MNVEYYFSHVNSEKFPALFPPDFIEKSQLLRERYKDQETHRVGYETVLTDTDNSCDIAFLIDTGGELAGNIYMEFDHEVYEAAVEDGELTPCVFLDATCLRPERNAEELSPFFKVDLAGLVGADKACRFREPLLALADKLSGMCSSLFQVGSMDSRMPSDSLRVYIICMNAKKALSLLDKLSWPGDRALAVRILSDMEAYALGGRFIISFDLFADQTISEKIGMEFLIDQSGTERLDDFLDCLCKKGHCVPGKADALKDWVRERPVWKTDLQHDIAHFKYTIASGRIKTVKAYLRQSDDLGIYGHHRAFRDPVLMDIVLTADSPIQGMQRNTHTDAVKEINPKVAIQRIREAGEAGIDKICLSGGAPVYYPHLSELIHECSSLGLTSSVEVSGVYYGKETLAGMIGDGVDEIKIRLNGPCDELCLPADDGCVPASKLLEDLQDLRFENTKINWVMHGSRACELQDMIKLCERYGVSELVILGFRPDAVSDRKSFSTADRMNEAERQISSYKGSVTVTADACFSQLRALLGESVLLGNRNVGIGRGCGAGRDRISVNVDGKLTPCRYLNVTGEYDTIAEYWEKSAFLQELRSAEDKREEPCRGCRYEKNCLPCMAAGYSLRDDIPFGLKKCSLAAD